MGPGALAVGWAALGGCGVAWWTWRRRRCHGHQGVEVLTRLIGLVGLLALLGIATWAWGIRLYRVSSGSMGPGIQPGAVLVVAPLAYVAHGPRRGDVVVFAAPDRRDRVYVKRVVGLPGDAVSWDARRLMVAGVAVERTRVGQVGLDAVAWRERLGEARYEVLLPAAAVHADGAVVVPRGCYFVLGDNRAHSRDSRAYGCIPRARLLGRVLWSW